MKKLVVILLIVLPFLLIYFISITGRILEKYSHIYVEDITVENSDHQLINIGEYIEVEKDSTKTFYIVLGPELASNKDVTISNINPSVCSYVLNGDVLELTGIKYGQTKIVITSVDRTQINYTLNIKVTDAVPTALSFSNTQIKIMPQKTDQLPQPMFSPSTTKYDYKGLIWTSSDEEIVQIEDETSGLIKTKKEGTAVVTARSTFNNELYATITVIVTFDKSDLDVHFTHEKSSPYVTNQSIFDLKTITDFSDSFKEQYSLDERFNQFVYKLDTSSKDVDISQISNGIIVFNELKSPIVIKVSIYMNGEEIPIDTITIAYQK